MQNKMCVCVCIYIFTQKNSIQSQKSNEAVIYAMMWMKLG